MNKCINRYFLVGIKGTGMSALACYLKDLGHTVIGSDVDENFGFETEMINKQIEIYAFSKNNIKPTYIYIIGNAYNEENIEVQEIIKEGYKYYYYHEFISTLPGIKIGVCGTHGKTTTTHFLKELLKREDIAYIIGNGSGKALKNYKYLIFEACEYQDHFLSYKPDILVITNIDYDHPDYFKNIGKTINSFYKASNNASKVITLSKINYQIKRKTNINTTLVIDDEIITIPFVGIHNINNFLLAYQVTKELNIKIDKDFNSLTLPKRRTESSLINGNIIIEDYAHHPTEIKALHDMLRIKYPNKKIIVLFQPHTYSRTIAYLNKFKEVLSLFDKVYVDSVFTSKREPYNSSKETLINKAFESFDKYRNFDFSKNLDENKDIYLLLGAGNINKRFKESLLIYEKE